jgi:translation initiation factor 3 subunit I
LIDFGELMVEVKDPIAEIPTQESKATVAGWSFLDKYIIMGHENGMVSQWDWKVLLPLRAMFG